MSKKIKFVSCHGNSTVNDAFLLEYKKSLLFTLLQENVINQAQLDECLTHITSQSTGRAL